MPDTTLHILIAICFYSSRKKTNKKKQTNKHENTLSHSDSNILFCAFNYELLHLLPQYHNNV